MFSKKPILKTLIKRKGQLTESNSNILLLHVLISLEVLRFVDLFL